jgi:hypothetical protein
MMGCVRGDLGGIGLYRLADAYADSLQMAARYSPSLPEAICGAFVRTLFRLSSKETLIAMADLVIVGAESTTIKVHDFFPALYFERGWVGRRLDVIAALEMQPEDLEKPFPGRRSCFCLGDPEFRK